MTTTSPVLEAPPAKVEAKQMKPVTISSARGSGLFTEEATARVSAAFTSTVSRAIAENAEVASRNKKKATH